MRLVPEIGLTTKQEKSCPARAFSLSACPVVSVTEAAAWTVTGTPAVLAWSFTPCSIDWKNGLSRPLMTAATLALPPAVEAVASPLLDPQAEARRVAPVSSATPRAVRVAGVRALMASSLSGGGGLVASAVGRACPLFLHSVKQKDPSFGPSPTLLRFRRDRNRAGKPPPAPG